MFAKLACQGQPLCRCSASACIVKLSGELVIKTLVLMLAGKMHRKCPRPQALSAEQTNGKIEGGSGPIELSDHGSLLAISMPVIPEADRLLQVCCTGLCLCIIELLCQVCQTHKLLICCQCKVCTCA